MLTRVLLFLYPSIVMAQSSAAYTIQTVAGNNSVGDGGSASAAILSQPEGVAVDSAGNLYIADADDSRIRRVSPGLSSKSCGKKRTSSVGFSSISPSARSLHANKLSSKRAACWPRLVSARIAVGWAWLKRACTGFSDTCAARAVAGPSRRATTGRTRARPLRGVKWRLKK